MELKDIGALLISSTALIVSGLSLWKSFRQDRKAEELKKPLIDFVLPRFEGPQQYEASYSIRNRGDAPLRLDAILVSDEWPVRLSVRNRGRAPIIDMAHPDDRPRVWRVPVGAIIEEGARYDGTVWVEGQYPGERLGNYTAVFTFELSVRDREEARLRFDIRRMAQD